VIPTIAVLRLAVHAGTAPSPRAPPRGAAASTETGCSRSVYSHSEARQNGRSFPWQPTAFRRPAPTPALTRSALGASIPRLIRPGLQPGCARPEWIQSHEENLSAQRAAPQAHPRIPRPHGDRKRSRGHSRPSRQGPASTDTVVRPRRAGSRLARLTRSQRLRTPAEFRRVFAEPVRAGDRHVTVLARANGRDHARLGLSAARRHLRRSVDRNRFKRIVRESFRAHQGSLAGLDVVVLARGAAAQADARELRASVDRQWGFIRRRQAATSRQPGTHG